MPGKKNRFQAVVRTKQQKKPKESKQKQKKKTRKSRDLVLGIRNAGSSKSFAAFRAALHNPFSPLAIGCQVPDMFAFPTVPYHLRTTISTNTSSVGTFGIVLYPSPCLTYTTLTTGGTGASTSGTATFSQNATSGYVVAPDVLSGVLTEYRTVAWGLRIIPKDTAFASKGRYVVATLPCSHNAPSWVTMNNVTALNETVVTQYCCGVAISGANQGYLVNQPTARVFTAQDLLRGEIAVNGLPLNPSFYDFKGVQQNTFIPWNTGQILADEAVFTASTGVLANSTTGGRKDTASLAGGMAVAIVVTGAPPNVNEFDIELIYHLEGTPNTNAGGNTTFVPSSARPSVGNTNIVEKLLSAAHTASNIVSMVADPVGAAVGLTKAVAFGNGRDTTRDIPMLMG